MRSSFEERPLLPHRGGFVALVDPAAETAERDVAPVQEPTPDDDREQERAAELAAAIEALATAVRGWRAVESRELDAARDAVIELGLAVARRVLERELDPLTESFAGHVHRALEEIVEPGGADIFLSPSDLERIREADETALRALEEEGSAHLRADPQLDRGDARVEAGDHQVDLRLDAILARFREALANDAGDGMAS